MEMTEKKPVVDGVLFSCEDEKKEYKKEIFKMKDLKKTLNSSINPGRRVCDEIHYEMLGAVFPKSYGENHLVVGEPYGHCPEEDKDTFETFIKSEKLEWVFLGNITLLKALEKVGIRNRRCTKR